MYIFLLLDDETIRSSILSPLKSPVVTAVPRNSLKPPSTLNPFDPFIADKEVSRTQPDDLPNTAYADPVFELPQFAVRTMSSILSPFKSPLATANPACDGVTPFSLIPCDRLSVDGLYSVPVQYEVEPQ